MSGLQVGSQFAKAKRLFKEAIDRNSLILKAITFAFFILLTTSIIVTIVIFNMAPDLIDTLGSFTETTIGTGDIPSPYTGSLYSFIFFNNIGHFWNPLRMIVWIPAVGPLLLGLEILLNSGLIGIVAVMVGISKGVAYPILGLIPHGIIEIPAFLFQLSAIVLWQVTITEAIINKLRGKKLDNLKFKLGLQDTIIFAVTSIMLMGIAAVIETFITPYLLGL
ncbi:MAG: stage II sporulation protein M [Candidatus Bathyarchaeota archaeon]|nr:stage II sporulation protein M [Candidatus Bathyarchaeum tardum]WGM89199.1 MAG: stage II sporulation protein M [Candidatus Bathyarchaeum tardum]